jgi:hypothetical protein
MNAMKKTPKVTSRRSYPWGERLKAALEAKGLKTAEVGRRVARLLAAREDPPIAEGDFEEFEVRMINNLYKYVTGTIDQPRGPILSDIASVVLRVQQFNPVEVLKIPRKRLYALHTVVWAGRGR